MDPRTEQFLRHAQHHHEFASSLLDDPPRATLSREWATVAAFYAAVHYVNAYLWERGIGQPRDHADRARMIGRTRDLRPVQPAYERLFAAAYFTRYRPGFRITDERAQQLVRRDLATIAATVTSLLAR